ncbi:MAG: transposase, partial [Sphaerochaetaceae bacterium]|nr:transposase [Sphaerochaetaceae bacterium]
GLSIPANEHAWSVNSSRRLNEMLASNERIQAAYVFREMLQSALACMNAAIMRAALTRYIAAIRKSRIKELEGIASMLEKRIDGIVSHAIYHISNGIVEGTNNMIKTLRRQAYGFRDDECFFLKIWDESRKGLEDRRYNRLHRKR